MGRANAPRPAIMDAKELRKLILDWPHVMRCATDDWARKFAFDMWAHAANGRWRPTLKQARVMRRMIRELNRKADDNPILIE